MQTIPFKSLVLELCKLYHLNMTIPQSIRTNMQILQIYQMFNKIN